MKPPIPPMDLDPIDPEEFMKLPKEQLDNIIHDKVKLYCCVAGCQCGPGIRDYGISPWYYVRGKWQNLLKMIWFCGKHWKIHGKNHSKIPDYSPKEGYKVGPSLYHLKTVYLFPTPNDSDEQDGESNTESEDDSRGAA